MWLIWVIVAVVVVLAISGGVYTSVHHGSSSSVSQTLDAGKQVIPSTPTGTTTTQPPPSTIKNPTDIDGVVAYDTGDWPGPNEPGGTELGHDHVTGPVKYALTPPAGGPHNAVWMNAGVYTEPIPSERAVHNLEHGGVVVAYRCDAGDAAGCAALRAQLEDVVRALPSEPSCALSFDGGINRRVVLTEDPLIDDRVAAAAWGWTYHANCVDVSSLSAFVYARTGRGPEETCAEGF